MSTAAERDAEWTLREAQAAFSDEPTSGLPDLTKKWTEAALARMAEERKARGAE